ncbi:IS607 family transposase [Massilia sp. CFBP9026]|uniref:IS607 family transposase n=1 Tax=Massilia sp. CFBP9026 TaxID=3096536 RepID=UPI002A6A062D|nr:IS607 family transposase [Massilia sp. CFBP9026]MDY0960821.1 IS607 family transposase [Massilia sp. CFBP9026]
MEMMLKTGAAARRLGVTPKTLQRWDRCGTFSPLARSPTGLRLYSETQIAERIGLQSRPAPYRIIGYCRVSSAAQKPDLRNQRRVLEEFCTARGLANVEFIEEIGGGLNFKRPRLLELTDAIGRGEVRTLVLAHRDRLTRFGYEWFEHIAHEHGCELLVLNQERMSPEQEMVQDMMTIVHCFSSRLYGLRNYRRQLDVALNKDVRNAAVTSHPA